MASIATRSVVSELLSAKGVVPKKRFGQNFLVDARVADKAAAAANLSKSDNVLEIGPGLGGLTEKLAQEAGSVVAIEIDRDLASLLETSFKPVENVQIICADILKTDLRALMEEKGWKTCKAVANLPYYITTPIIMMLLESRLPIESITIMVQKEVAYRLGAKPGTKDYGSLTVTVSYFSDPSIDAIVPSNCFHPRPNVDSAIVTLKLRPCPYSIDSEDLLFQVTRAAFGHRRKTLANCLSAADPTLPKSEIEALLTTLGLGAQVRGEALSLEEFVTLSNALGKAIEAKKAPNGA
jgi:16S rRNA (adenine1518-N6/adenine1519-N6)-dimethyltransferase